ncbi:hypothetical protein F5Y17DRAFT_436452, partial [Xylariaceae sp. FL0594]
MSRWQRCSLVGFLCMYFSLRTTPRRVPCVYTRCLSTLTSQLDEGRYTCRFRAHSRSHYIARYLGSCNGRPMSRAGTMMARAS